MRCHKRALTTRFVLPYEPHLTRLFLFFLCSFTPSSPQQVAERTASTLMKSAGDSLYQMLQKKKMIGPTTFRKNPFASTKSLKGIGEAAVRDWGGLKRGVHSDTFDDESLASVFFFTRRTSSPLQCCNNAIHHPNPFDSLQASGLFCQIFPCSTLIQWLTPQSLICANRPSLQFWSFTFQKHVPLSL